MKARRITALLLALLLAVGIAGCGGKTTEKESGSISVTDMTGREVTLEEPADKIVALTAADCEILYAIGAGDTLVGRGEYCDYPAEVADVPAVESGSETNIEQIIALGPDLVLISTMAQTSEHIESLEAAGIKVVASESADIDGVFEAIGLIGAITGKDDAAAGVIASMRNTFDELSEKVPEGGGGTIYFEVSPLEYGLWAAGSGTFMEELADILGLENIFADTEGWAQVSEEQVINRDPDYIVTTTMSFEGAPDPVEEIKTRAGWENITAVTNGSIINDSSSMMVRPGPRLADAARALYNFVYGGQ
jgi:iron complex transport system substrate-binding protein